MRWARTRCCRARSGYERQVWFSERPIRNWRDAERYANEELFTRWWQEMLLRGVLFHPSQYENLFLSLVHSAQDVQDMLGAAQEAFTVIGRRRPAPTRMA